MIVEFIGTPGAGKTTFMPFAQDHFRDQYFCPYSVVEAARPFAARTSIGKKMQYVSPVRMQRFLLWQIFYAYSYVYRSRFSAYNKKLMKTVLNYQSLRPISTADKRHVLRWYLHLTGSYEFLRTYAQAGEMLLFDEGFVHRVVQLFASENESPNFEEVKNYLDLIPKPDLVIYPKTSASVCEERVFERGVWKRFQKKGRNETGKFIRNAHKIVNYAVQYIRTKGWVVIEVDNNHVNLATSSFMLKSALEDLLIRAPEVVDISK